MWIKSVLGHRYRAEGTVGTATRHRNINVLTDDELDRLVAATAPKHRLLVDFFSTWAHAPTKHSACASVTSTTATSRSPRRRNRPEVGPADGDCPCRRRCVATLGRARPTRALTNWCPG